MNIFGSSEVEIIKDEDIFLLPLDGAVPKFTLKQGNNLYMIKLDNSDSHQYLSEYLASKLANLLNIPCQEVDIVKYRDNLCCKITLFNQFRFKLHKYVDIGDSSLGSFSEDVRDIKYTLDYILDVLEHYEKCNIDNKDIIEFFIIMVLFDTVIGNFDRHWGNWGFLRTDTEDILCPLYDNGSSLFPKLTDEVASICLSNKNEILRRVYDLPKSQIKNSKNKKYRYKDLIIDIIELGYGNLIKGFIDKFESINLVQIFDEKVTNIFSDVIINFYINIIELRFKKLIKEPYIENLTITKSNYF